MLLQFSVENYQSFKDRATLDLIPSKDREHPENITVRGQNKALNVTAIYGANASGKSCFFRAMTIAIIMIRTSNSRQVHDTLPVIPFQFDAISVSKPSKFEFQFVAEDGNRYIYGFSSTAHRITEEYLYRYSSQRPTKIFVRKEGESYAFTAKESNLLNPLVAWNTPNKLFLATATMWNAQSTKPAFEWFAKQIDTYTDLMQIGQDSFKYYQGENSTSYIEFTEKLLKSADINISRLTVNVRKISVTPNMAPMVPGILVNGQWIPPQEQTELEVIASHLVSDENGIVRDWQLSLSEESQGTQLLFTIGPLLKHAFEKGLTLMIDEIDQSLHTFIVRYLVNAFRNPSINKAGAQLIMTTHNTSILSLDIFRREQIYFVEKNKNTAVSNLYSLDEYSVRKGENIEKGYLSGRYGAVPHVQPENDRLPL